MGNNRIEVPGLLNGTLTEEDIFHEMDGLVGLENIKKRLHDYAGYIKYMKLTR
jgi:hypothetical protein